MSRLLGSAPCFSERRPPAVAPISRLSRIVARTARCASRSSPRSVAWKICARAGNWSDCCGLARASPTRPSSWAPSPTARRRRARRDGSGPPWRSSACGRRRAAARQDYRIEGVERLGLHHLYRAMGWLGEELAEHQQAGATSFAPRCLKDVMEEELFARRRDLFTSLDLGFMDTTSLYFEGAGGQTLGRRGFSKDHRPDLNQMILAVLLDGDGRPVCTEMWPGNTADVSSLIPAVDRLRKRFSINRVCVVADRGMISAETIAELEARKLLYILGVRERSDKLVRELVLDDPAPFVPFFLTKRKKEIDYEAKAVTLAGRR